ncbi:Cold shock protein CspA [Labilithrix luteola]|uniref:Cold shock protein CspA n=2 Tax=Labilithrix luteola TaxID=1391654 RepID=A0A0K1Q322_9BACT|nr:Cold shock protein CspA [Labilithrix luteola]
MYRPPLAGVVIELLHERTEKKADDMAEGTIKRLTDKGFGFIETSTGKDLFFHMSAVEGVRFEDLRQGQRVSFNEGQGPKGPRAENVKVI